MKNIRVAIADDQSMFRSGLALLLNGMDGIRVVLEASNGKELVAGLRGNAVDLVMLDYRMAGMNGINATRIIRSKYDDIKVLMLSAFDDEEIILNSYASGVNGYLTKDDQPAEIGVAIDRIMTTGYYFSERAYRLAMLNATGKKTGSGLPMVGEAVLFSDQEKMVMRLLARELNTREIAAIMLKSERTIDAYRAGIMKKTGTKNLAGIILYGVRHGIIEL